MGFCNDLFIGQAIEIESTVLTFIFDKQMAVNKSEVTLSSGPLGSVRHFRSRFPSRPYIGNTEYIGYLGFKCTLSTAFVILGLALCVAQIFLQVHYLCPYQ